MRLPAYIWVRAFGYCLVWKDTRREHVLFSERYGYGCRRLRLGPYLLILEAAR